jgi:hypothetical protein
MERRRATGRDTPPPGLFERSDLCRCRELESEDGRRDRRMLVCADNNCEGSAAGDHDGRGVNDARCVQRGHHDESQAPGGCRKRGREYIVAVDVGARRHKGCALAGRTAEDIRQVTRRKWRGERQQNLGYQPERAQSPEKSNHHVPIARRVRIQKEGHRRAPGPGVTVASLPGKSALFQRFALTTQVALTRHSCIAPA